MYKFLIFRLDMWELPKSCSFKTADFFEIWRFLAILWQFLQKKNVILLAPNQIQTCNFEAIFRSNWPPTSFHLFINGFKFRAIMCSADCIWHAHFWILIVNVLYEKPQDFFCSANDNRPQLHHTAPTRTEGRGNLHYTTIPATPSA